MTLHHSGAFLKLVAANIGAVIMPWMIYFQQSAVAAKRLTPGHEEALERTNTLIGSILTQLIMIAVMVTVAAAREVTGSTRIESIDDIADALAVSLGQTAAKVREMAWPNIVITHLDRPACPHFHVTSSGPALSRSLRRRRLRRLRRRPRRLVGYMRGARHRRKLAEEFAGRRTCRRDARLESTILRYLRCGHRHRRGDYPNRRRCGRS